MNLTDFRDSALLKLDIGGPFGAQVADEQTEEYIVVQISQNEDTGSRRRRQPQVMVLKFSFIFSEVCFITHFHHHCMDLVVMRFLAAKCFSFKT